MLNADPPVHCYLKICLRPFHVDAISEIPTTLFRLGFMITCLGHASA